MKYCPRCEREYPDADTACAVDGSALRPKATTAGTIVGTTPSASAPPGSLGMRISSSHGTALGNSALSSVFGASQTPEADFDPFDSPTVTMPLQGPASGVIARHPAPTPEPSAPTPEPSAPTPEPSAPTPGPVDPTTATLLPSRETPATEPDPESEPDLSGQTIAGRYRLVQRLGQGGMGVVYQAIDERLEKNVAVKILRADFARRADVVARFTQEAKSAARIKHENVLDVTDYGRTEDGSFYIAMELLVGNDLADLLARDGHLPLERALDIAIQICRALSSAHREGVVHRDLKPENVFLQRNTDGHESVKIVDFGIAHMKDLSGGSNENSRKLTRTGMLFGTPEYMSPEQATGKPIDHRVDVYATGVILYEMFSGRVPFTADTFMGVLMQHINAQPPAIRDLNPNSTVSPEAEAVVFKALAKDPAQRYASMADLADDLARVRDGIQTHAQPPLAPTLPLSPHTPSATTGVARTIENELPSRPRRTIVLGIAAIAAAAIAVGFFALHEDPPPAPITSVASVRNAPPPTRLRTTPNANTTVDAATVLVVNTPAPTTVELHITASVAGARISAEPLDGGPGFSCDAPCTHTAIIGTSLRISATEGHQRGSVEFTPTADQTAVNVTLSAPAQRPRPRTRPQQDTPPRRPRCGEVDPHSGLLIPCF